jgi:hypothetical protein
VNFPRTRLQHLITRRNRLRERYPLIPNCSAMRVFRHVLVLSLAVVSMTNGQMITTM